MLAPVYSEGIHLLVLEHDRHTGVLIYKIVFLTSFNFLSHLHQTRYTQA